jgi:hypothetical protein
MRTAIRTLLLPLFLTASLSVLAGCGGSPTSAPPGSGADMKEKMMQMQQHQKDMMNKAKGGPPAGTEKPM